MLYHEPLCDTGAGRRYRRGWQMEIHGKYIFYFERIEEWIFQQLIIFFRGILGCFVTNLFTSLQSLFFFSNSDDFVFVFIYNKFVNVENVHTNFEKRLTDYCF